MTECVVCGVGLAADDERWLSGWPYCPECYDTEVATEWEPDEDATPVVDVPVGEYL